MLLFFFLKECCWLVFIVFAYFIIFFNYIIKQSNLIRCTNKTKWFDISTKRIVGIYKLTHSLYTKLRIYIIIKIKKKERCYLVRDFGYEFSRKVVSFCFPGAAKKCTLFLVEKKNLQQLINTPHKNSNKKKKKRDVQSCVVVQQSNNYAE
jgi:hypothetical protein